MNALRRFAPDENEKPSARFLCLLSPVFCLLSLSPVFCPCLLDSLSSEPYVATE
ncbi:MAG: hypothetical protein LBD06_02725 [Candidatus Accumulibacter sp.]|nr:hypothetical protein [Accumulibacter sp.]